MERENRVLGGMLLLVFNFSFNSQLNKMQNKLTMLCDGIWIVRTIEIRTILIILYKFQFLG